jgi:hypothetical protein
MAGFDPDIFGSSQPASAPAGFDPDVFSTGAPRKAPSAGSARSQVESDAISKGAREFAGQGSDALGGVSQAALNALGGFLRGAGSIGATAARPFESGQENDQRRARIDENMQAVGAQPDSWMYRGGKLGGEIAGTAGVGGALANGVRAALPAVQTLGGVNAINGIARGLESGGFRVGSLAGTPAGVATRLGTGGVVGGVSAGMVNPDEAGFGAAVGAAFPGVAQVMGKAGDVASSAFGRSMQPNQRTLDTARQSMDAGYVIPPNMLQPGFANQVIESISGKQATQQIASTRNNAVTERLVRDALGIAPDVQLTQGTLDSLRKTAGKAYAEVSSLSPQAAADLEALKTARNESQGWFKAYNRSARPDDLAQAKQFRAEAETLETALEAHAAAAGKKELIPALRDARKEIAKTYTVGRALNDASGTVDARVLGRMSEKGLPLSDGLEIAGQFASAFPTVAKSPQQIGSPAAHNLKSIASMAFGGGGYGLLGPAGVAAATLPFVAPPIARAAMFSKGAQRGLLEASYPFLDEAAPMGLLTRGGYYGAPLLSGQ